MKNVELQMVMSRAWQIKRNADLMYNGGCLFSECLRMAWAELKKSDDLANEMRHGVKWFEFYKVSGEIRRACGTLRPDLLPPTNGEGNRRQNDSLQVYFDLEKNEFRCYKKQNLIRVLTENEILNA
jgi:hypothetical protein